MGSVEEICDHIALINQSKKVLDGNIHDIKEQYKTGIFEIETLVEANTEEVFQKHQFNLLEQEIRGKRKRIKFQKTNGESNNELLHKLTTNLELCSFREVIPDMNEVFIQVVNQANQKER
jgi:ABC-2 type transport system ATP-binding protein